MEEREAEKGWKGMNGWMEEEPCLAVAKKYISCWIRGESLFCFIWLKTSKQGSY